MWSVICPFDQSSVVRGPDAIRRYSNLPESLVEMLQHATVDRNPSVEALVQIGGERISCMLSFGIAPRGWRAGCTGSESGRATASRYRAAERYRLVSGLLRNPHGWSRGGSRLTCDSAMPKSNLCDFQILARATPSCRISPFQIANRWWLKI